MKKILVALVAALVSFSAFALVYTNQAGEVITVTLLTEKVAPASQTTTPTAWVPIVIADVDLTQAEAETYTGVAGQLLVNTASTSGVKIVYISLGGTNWALVK